MTLLTFGAFGYCRPENGVPSWTILTDIADLNQLSAALLGKQEQMQAGESMKLN